MLASGRTERHVVAALRHAPRWMRNESTHNGRMPPLQIKPARRVNIGHADCCVERQLTHLAHWSHLGPPAVARLGRALGQPNCVVPGHDCGSRPDGHPGSTRGSTAPPCPRGRRYAVAALAHRSSRTGSERHGGEVASRCRRAYMRRSVTVENTRFLRSATAGLWSQILKL